MDAHNIREEELQTLLAIYEDRVTIDFAIYSGDASLPIALDSSTIVKLTAGEDTVKTALIDFLPSLILKFQLPEKYPYGEPPHFSLETTVLDKSFTEQLLIQINSIWYDAQAQVLFTAIDMLQEAVANVAEGLVYTSFDCGADQVLFEQIVEFDREKKLQQFNASTFTCEVCQRNRSGEMCSRFDDCGHVFCDECLKGFFSSLIDSGEVEKVHCPDFNCSKKILLEREKSLRLDALSDKHFDFEEFRAKTMTPSIKVPFLQKILGTGPSEVELTRKYMQIFADHQHVLIAKLFPTRLVSCPRKHCPAMIFWKNTQDRLVICRECGYSFCNICRKSYHSSSRDCTRSGDNKIYHGIAVEDIQLWIAEGKATPAGNELRCKYGTELLRKVADEYAMDRLFDELINDESQDFSRCPTCDLVIQRSEGCNKMKCSSCYTSFCNICGLFLDQDHPYDHFKDRSSPCYNRLFHGMPGTEDLNG